MAERQPTQQPDWHSIALTPTVFAQTHQIDLDRLCVRLGRGFMFTRLLCTAQHENVQFRRVIIAAHLLLNEERRERRPTVALAQI